jgi:hypothetical protein
MRQGLWALNMQANWRILEGAKVTSVSITDPAVDSIFIVNMAIEVSGTAVGSGSIYATFDDGPSRGTGSAGGGTFTIDVTALAADIASPAELQIRRTVDDVVIGTLACLVVQAALWAPANDVLGTPVTTAASVPANPDDWNTNSYITVTGSGPYELRPTVDEERHYAFQLGLTNGAGTYADLNIVCRPVGAQRWVRLVIGTTGGDQLWFDAIDGIFGTVGGNLSTSTISKVGTTVTVSARYRAVVAGNKLAVVELTQANGLFPVYVGNPADGLSIDSVAVAQTRLQTDTDKSGTAADLTQGTAANQLLYQASFASLAGLPTALSEIGRSAYMTSTKAALCAACNGTDTPNLVAGIARLSATVGCETPWWYDGSADYYIPLLYNGPDDWKCIRHTGAVNSSRAFPGVTDVMILAARTYCVIFNRLGDLKSELYLDGVLVSTTAAHTSCTLVTTTFYNCPLNLTADQEYMDCVVLPSAHTYAAMRAAMKAMCKPYNDAVPGSLSY